MLGPEEESFWTKDLSENLERSTSGNYGQQQNRRQRNKKQELQVGSCQWDDRIMDNREGYHTMMAGICLIQMNLGTSSFCLKCKSTANTEEAQGYGGCYIASRLLGRGWRQGQYLGGPQLGGTGSPSEAVATLQPPQEAHGAGCYLYYSNIYLKNKVLNRSLQKI